MFIRIILFLMVSLSLPAVDAEVVIAAKLKEYFNVRHGAEQQYAVHAQTILSRISNGDQALAVVIVLGDASRNLHGTLGDFMDLFWAYVQIPLEDRHASFQTAMTRRESSMLLLKNWLKTIAEDRRALRMAEATGEMPGYFSPRGAAEL